MTPNRFDYSNTVFHSNCSTDTWLKLDFVSTNRQDENKKKNPAQYPTRDPST